MRQNPFTNSEIATKYESWYSEDGLRVDQQEKSLLKDLLKRFPDARSLLEIGCGTGHFTKWFEEECGLSTIGMDKSPAMLLEADKQGMRGLFQADAQNLPLAADSIDLAAFITTLEFLPDPLSALREAYRVCKQGMLLGVINQHSRLGRRYRKKGGMIWEHARFFTVQGLQQMVKRVSGEYADVSWETTLWPLFQGHLPLPWGGFIGMAVKWEKPK